MGTALAASILIFLILAILSNLVMISNEEQVLSGEREGLVSLTEMNLLADEIQTQIVEFEVSLEDMDDVDWEKENIDIIVTEYSDRDYLAYHFLGGGDESNIIEGATEQGLKYYFYNNNSVYEINVEDTAACIVMYQNVNDSRYEDLLLVLSALISIVSFFLLSLKMIKPILNYIKTIEKGVKIIAEEDLTYKLEVVGNNELSSLANEINDMGQTIYENVEKEKELDRNQRTLITNISHDLRTPLTSILGYSDLIEQQVDADGSVSDYAKTLKKNAIRLEKLVDDLFLYTKITSDDMPLHMTDVDLSVMIRQILELRSGNYQFESIQGDLEQGKMKVHVDPDKFHRIMENILSNADKYGVEDEMIEIFVEERDQKVQIVVKNVTEDKLEDKKDFLLERLYVANEERKEGSSGLGLSIVKELTEKMNGEIKIDYCECKFEVRLSFPKIASEN
jgi:signal transduction histidine kinase